MIDTGTSTVLGAPIPVGDGPREVAVSPDGRWAYVTNGQFVGKTGDVSVIDTAAGTVVGPPVVVGINPFGIAITPDGRRLYVANSGSDTVSAIDTGLR